MAQVDPGPGGAVEVRWEEYEVQLLSGLMDEMKLLLEADIPKSDSVISRLFPDAYDEPDDARAFNELVGGELSETKRAALATARDTLSENRASWSREEAEAWLTLLTDLRLAIGTRLDVDEETMASDLDPDSPDAAALSVLHWLGWVQESVLAAMTGEEENGP